MLIYMRIRNRRKRPIKDRFDEQWREDENGCWLWVRHLTSTGYGNFGLGRASEGKAKAHRVSWELYRGAIPEGKHVLHRCHVPRCVNPDHLYIGDRRDNMRDMAISGRQHLQKLTPDQAWEILHSEESWRVLAAQFGVTRQTISHIRNGHSWKHLDAE